MRKKTLHFSLTLFSLIGLVMSALTQGTPEIKVVHNANEFSVTNISASTLKSGDFFSIKIENINSNLYDFSINGSDTSLSKPAEFPTFKSISLEDVTALLSNILPSTESIVSTFAGENPKSNVAKAIEKYKPENLSSILEKQEANSLNTALELFKQFQKSLEKSNLEIRDLETEVNSLFNEVNIFATATSRGLVCNNKTPTLCDFLERIQDIKAKLDSQKSTLQSSNQAFQSSTSILDFSEVIQSSTLLKTSQTELEETYKKLIANIEKLNTEINGENYKTSVNALSNYELKSIPVAYQSLPMQMVKEQKEIKISIKPKDENSGLPSWESTYFIPGPTSQYAGTGASFYFSGLRNENFSTIKTINVSGDTTLRLVQEDREIGEIGTAVIFRLGKLSENRVVGYHVSVGPGISLSDKPKPRLLFGGGLSIGKTHGFSIETGGIAGFVNKKSNVYELEQDYIEIENPTVTKLDLNIFLSVGYIYRF
jgi:hypothetical protein